LRRRGIGTQRKGGRKDGGRPQGRFEHVDSAHRPRPPLQPTSPSSCANCCLVASVSTSSHSCYRPPRATIPLASNYLTLFSATHAAPPWWRMPFRHSLVCGMVRRRSWTHGPHSPARDASDAYANIACRGTATHATALLFLPFPVATHRIRAAGKWV